MNNPKNIFALLILAITGLFYFTFVQPFKVEAVDTVESELNSLKSAYNKATEQTQLKTLRLKRQQLSTENLNILDNYIPRNLHSGTFVYNLSQMANQEGLVVKGIQYSIVDTTIGNVVPGAGERKLYVEYTLEGRYDSFSSWLQKVENANVLVDVEAISGRKVSNTSELINFTVKLYTYGLNID